MPDRLQRVSIIIEGPHDTGRTTLARLIEDFLQQNGFCDVNVRDTEPLPVEQKDRFYARLERNRTRPISIVVRLPEKE